MHQKPETFDALFAKAKWSTLDLRDGLGVPYVTARKMRERGSVTVVHWPRLIEMAAAKGIHITVDDLIAMRSRKVSEKAA